MSAVRAQYPRPGQPVNNLGKGISGAPHLQRINMALRSCIEDEIEWGVRCLVRYSYNNITNISIEQIPGAMEALVERIHPVLLSSPTRNTVEKATEAALVIRNFCLVEKNVISIIKVRMLKEVMVDVVQLADATGMQELQFYCLDILESMSFFVVIDNEMHPMYNLMKSLLLSKDRSSIRAALMSLAKFAANDNDNRLLQDISPPAIEKVRNLLLLNDEQLLSAALDFLYQYTTYAANVRVIFDDKASLRTMFSQLVRLLMFGAIPKKLDLDSSALQKIYPPLKASPPIVPRINPPALPQAIIAELNALKEPRRAIEWVRTCYEMSPKDDLTQVSVWQAYQSRFFPYVKEGKPLLQPGDMIKNVSVSYSSAAAMLLEDSGTKRFIIRGIKPRKMPKDLQGRIWIQCQWQKGKEPCRFTGPDLASIGKHIFGEHLQPPKLQIPNVPQKRPMEYPASLAPAPKKVEKEKPQEKTLENASIGEATKVQGQNTATSGQNTATSANENEHPPQSNSLQQSKEQDQSKPTQSGVPVSSGVSSIENKKESIPEGDIEMTDQGRNEAASQSNNKVETENAVSSGETKSEPNEIETESNEKTKEKEAMTNPNTNTSTSTNPNPNPSVTKPDELEHSEKAVSAETVQETDSKSGLEFQSSQKGDGEIKISEPEIPLICRWRGCDREYKNKFTLWSHITTHMEEPVHQDYHMNWDSLRKASIELELTPRDEKSGEPTSISFVAALVLRNLVRNKDHGEELQSIVQSAAFQTVVKNNVLAGPILGEILALHTVPGMQM